MKTILKIYNTHERAKKEFNRDLQLLNGIDMIISASQHKLAIVVGPTLARIIYRVPSSIEEYCGYRYDKVYIDEYCKFSFREWSTLSHLANKVVYVDSNY
jgi:hypothetical protein